MTFLGLHRTDTKGSDPYATACRTLLAKARLSGCHLVLPLDVMLAEEKVNIQQVHQRLYYHTNPQQTILTRSDGIDYEFDTKILPAFEAIQLSQMMVMYAYDIGPQTQTFMTDMLLTSDICYIYGPVGMTEVSVFQGGQNALAQAIQTNVTQGNKTQIFLWGNETIEWLGRLIDSDNEFEGNLISSGHVKYANRNSSLFQGILLNLSTEDEATKQSAVMRHGLIQRPAMETEWSYSKPRPSEEDEEEEEEEEDEDEDDDDDEEGEEV
jgi:hypothetical protein